MKLIRSQLKRLRVGKLFATIAIGVVLLLNTACSSGNVQGARSETSSVQMGSEGYTNYKTSTNPNLSSSSSSTKQQAQKAKKALTADRTIRSNASDLSYRGSAVSENDRPDIGTLQQTSLPPLPNPKQPMIDRADPNSKVLERAGVAIQDASAFLQDTAKAASARPESQANPAIGQ